MAIDLIGHKPLPLAVHCGHQGCPWVALLPWGRWSPESLGRRLAEQNWQLIRVRMAVPMANPVDGWQARCPQHVTEPGPNRELLEG